MKFTSHETDTLLDILTWRRDVRHFQNTPIPDEARQLLHQAIELSPSVGNSRPWRIIEVESPEARARVIASHEKANADAVTDYCDEEKRKYLELKLAGLREAPLQIAFFTDNNPAAGRGLGRRTMQETLVFSTVTAIHQLWLMARTLNIGVGWVSILEPEKMNAILNVDPDWQFTAYLCIGYPQQQDELPELHRKGWQENEKTSWVSR